MKTLRLLLTALTLALVSTSIASESMTQVLAQPILRYGEVEAWDPNVEFKIIDVPFLDWSNHGQPAYAGIAYPHQMLTNAPRSHAPIESNLLVRYGIRIRADGLDTQDVWLHLEDARARDGLKTTVEDAAYAAIECIRIVAHRYTKHPVLHISAPASDQAKWTEVAARFNKHDLIKPFTKPAVK